MSFSQAISMETECEKWQAQASKETNEKPELKNAGRDSEFYDDTFDPTTPEHLWPDTDEEYADLPTYANVPSFGNSWLIGFEAVSEPCTPWAAGPWFNSTANTNPETKWVVDSADEACQGLSDFRHRTETVRKVVELNKCISMDYQCQDEEAILDEATLPGSVQSGSVPPADLSKRMKKAILTGSKALQKARALMGTMSHSSRLVLAISPAGKNGTLKVPLKYGMADLPSETLVFPLGELELGTNRQIDLSLTGEPVRTCKDQADICEDFASTFYTVITDPAVIRTWWKKQGPCLAGSLAPRLARAPQEAAAAAMARLSAAWRVRCPARAAGNAARRNLLLWTEDSPHVAAEEVARALATLRHCATGNEPVQQLHVAKTAGTSLCYWANRSGFRSLWPAQPALHRCQLQLRNLTWSSVERWLDLPLCPQLRYVAQLRRPVARTLHHFVHLLSFFRLGRFDLGPELFDFKATMEGFFAKLLSADTLSAMQLDEQGPDALRVRFCACEPGSAYLPPGAACTPPAVPSRRLSAPHLPAVAHVAAGAPVGALEPVGPSVPGPHIPVYAPAACEVYEEEDLQEYFQLGDEASNIYGNWRAPWAETAWTSEAEPEPVPEFDHQEAFRQEVMPDATESQFLALLDSLETRVELMSQMQKTRNAIHQIQGYDRREDRTSPHLSSHASPKKQEDLLDAKPLFQVAQDVSQTIDTNQLGGKHNFSDNFDDKEPNYESLARQMVMPFSREICGLNLEFSEDGYRATRVRGCRQSVAIGRAPLPFKEYGRYFEIVVTETVPGWVGGLGIGITPDPRSLTPGTLTDRMTPAMTGLFDNSWKRLPDKAWRIPKTSVLGYWGCAFLDGSEFRTSWHPDTLETGTKVGFLATSTGDFVLFVEGEAMVHIERRGDDRRSAICA
eukprot:g24489.t1